MFSIPQISTKEVVIAKTAVAVNSPYQLLGGNTLLVCIFPHPIQEIKGDYYLSFYKCVSQQSHGSLFKIKTKQTNDEDTVRTVCTSVTPRVGCECQQHNKSLSYVDTVNQEGSNTIYDKLKEINKKLGTKLM